jgi:aldehyde dehydrogenase (NAD+)
LRENLALYSRDLAREMGKTLHEAEGEVARSADFLEYYGSLGRLPKGEILPDERAYVDAYTLREPVGVVLAITPWNDPMVTPARKLAPALFAGNAVILKPATLTPLTAVHLADALNEAGLPRGALTLVTARGSATSRAFIESALVQAVTFTGSTEVGLSLERSAAGRNVRVEVEMGGKNAAVILNGTELDVAVAAVVSGAFGQAGQRCTATSRLLVEEGVYDEVLDQLLARTESLRIGAALADGTEMGPLVEKAHLEKVLGYVDSGKAEGARLLFGGVRLADGPLAHGYFVSPAVFVDVSEDMRIWREEIFGPVLAVCKVRSLDDAIATVNASEYGLSASIFTRDMGAAHAFTSRVEAGNIGVNLPTSGWDVHMPFGGFKMSGSGEKEHGLEGLRFYTRTKTIAVRYGL